MKLVTYPGFPPSWAQMEPSWHRNNWTNGLQNPDSPLPEQTWRTYRSRVLYTSAQDNSSY